MAAASWTEGPETGGPAVDQVGGRWAVALVSAGPALTVAAIIQAAAGGAIPASWTGMVGWTVLTLAWSPLFCSVPALITQDVRDRTLRGAGRMERAFRLLPELLSHRSQARDVHVASLYGLAAGAAVLLTLT